MDTLKKMFYLKLNGSESLLLYDQLEIKPFGLNQLQDVKKEPADVQQLTTVKEEVPWSSSLTEQDPDPLDIKEEKEELWSSQEGEQFFAQEETDINIVNVSVKTEEDEEKPQFSHIHRIKTEDNRETEPPTCCLATETKTEPNEDYKGPEPGRNLSPDSNSLPQLDENTSETSGDTSNGSESESEDRDDDWKKEKQIGNLQKEGHTAEKLLSCSDCDKKFRYKSELQYHLIRHTGEKPFMCSDCGKKYRTKSKLKDHMIIHTGEQPFMCSDCGEAFRSRGKLQYHKMSHCGEKPFMCSYCGKTFRYKSEIKCHMMIHTGEKPFMCSDCGKTFRFKSKLKMHKMIHTGETSFPCSNCDRIFRSKRGLTSHMIRHASEKALICGDCGKMFRSKRGFQYHMRHKGCKS